MIPSERSSLPEQQALWGKSRGPTHEEWQGQVVDLARLMGWRVLHVRRSVGKGGRWTTATSVVGWPDLFAWHEKQRRCIAIELKVGRDKPSPEQLAVLASLEAAGVATMVARPEDLPAVQYMLARQT